MTQEAHLEEAAAAAAAGINVAKYLVTLLLMGIAVLFFFRSVLPRLPRVLLRGRLRVRRIGLRGIRGIEWREKGFRRSRHRSNSGAKRPAAADCDEDEGLVVRIQHIYLVFHGWSRSPWSRSSARSDSFSASLGDDKNANAQLKPNASGAWMTIRVQGVGVRLPIVDASKEVEEQKAVKRRAKREARRAEEERRVEEEEERLRQLVASTVDAPLTPSLRPRATFTNTDTPKASCDANIKGLHGHEDYRGLPLRGMFTCMGFVRHSVLPALRDASMRTVRSLLFVVVSGLPAFSSFVDIEVHRIEVYVREAEAVLRVGRVGAQLSMALSASEDEQRRADVALASSSKCSAAENFRRKVSGAISGMPNRIGSGARGAASFLTAGLPAGRGSVMLRLEGVQVFETRHSARPAATSHTRSASGSSYAAPIASLHAYPASFNRQRRPTSPPVTLSRPSSPLSPLSRSNSSSIARPPGSPRDGAPSHEWLSFSASPPPTPAKLLRSKSTSGLTTMSTVPLSGWTDRWADWALEPFPTSSFSSDTGWARNAPLCGNAAVPIPEDARLLALPGLTTFELGLTLAPNLDLGTRESIQVRLKLAETTVGADALRRVVETLEERKAKRSAPSFKQAHEADEPSIATKQLAHRRISPPAKLLQALAEVSLTLPLVRVLADTAPGEGASSDNAHLPKSLQLCAVVQGLTFVLKDSGVTDARHRHWLGSCGMKGLRADQIQAASACSDAEESRTIRKGLKDRFRWAALRSRVRYVEHRRAFRIEAGMAKLQVLVGVNGQPAQEASELVLMCDASLRARTTWTPFGLLPSSSKYESVSFENEGNEQVAVIEASLGKLHGDLSLEHAASLAAYLTLRSAEREATRPKSSVPKQPSPSAGLSWQPPKMFVGVELNQLSYHVHTGGRGSSTSDDAPDVSLIASMPRVLVTFQGSYADQSIVRPDHERRAAWKAESKESRARKDSAKSASQPASNRPPPRQISPQGAASGISASLTMEEALAQMRELQEQLEKEQAGGAAAKPAKTSQRPAMKRRQSAVPICEFDVRYNFDARLVSEPIEAYFAISGEGRSSRRMQSTPLLGRHLPSLDVLRHHLIVLSAIETQVSGFVPGLQQDSDAISLRPNRAAVDVRCALEELDVDMWHPATIEAARRFVGTLSEAAAHAERPSASKVSEPVDKSAQLPATPAVDRMPMECGLYLSIGTIIAHLGGSDPNCDPHLSRGVGFEAKRVVFEARGARHNPRRSADVGGSWGARSALELPEDLSLTINALATRHGTAAGVKLSLFEIGLFPLLDAAEATRQHMAGTADHPPRRSAHRDGSTGSAMGISSPAIFAPAVWEFQKTKPKLTSDRTHKTFRQQDRSNFIFWMPFSATKMFLRPPGSVSSKLGSHAEEITVTTEGTRLLSFKIELLHTYCLLVAASALRSILPRRPHSKPSTPTAQAPAPASAAPSKQLPSYHLSFHVHDIHIAVALPNEVNLFLHLRRLDGRLSSTEGMSLAWESLMGAVESPKIPRRGLWEEAVRMRDWKISTGPLAHGVSSSPDGASPREIRVNGDGASVRIPFGYTIHPIIDNTTVAIKATKQLVHQFLTDDNRSVITPEAEEPKRIPAISINVRILTVEAQDDPFETSLNIIWRAGGDENQARLERDASFAEKAASMRADEMRRDSESFISTAEDSDSSSADSDNTAGGSRGTGLRSKRAAACSVKQARERLDAFNASSWIRRCTNAKVEQGRREDAVLRRIHGRYPVNSKRLTELPIKMDVAPRTAPLVRSSMTKLHLHIGPPSFPESEIRDFIRKQGKGVPKDLEYDLLLPMRLSWRMAEWRIELRDYPIPLLHVPPMHRDQPDDLTSWEMEADIVICEQLGGEESLRHVPAIVVPAATGSIDAREYGISVPKMAMPVKLYSSPIVKINTSYPTRFAWGQSMQPAIQDMMRVIDGITSPPHDPSPKIGIWDKIPLVAHGNLTISFKGEGEFHVYLKGSRDPYSVMGHGSGWVGCWRDDVDILFGHANKEQEFLQVRSGQFLLAIPDLRAYIDQAATGVASERPERPAPANGERKSRNSEDRDRTSLAGSRHRYRDKVNFRKVVINLTDGVQWGFGLQCERTCRDDTCKRRPRCSGSHFYRECRFFDAKPHWEVVTRSKEWVDKLPEAERTDSYAGYRTDHLHFSLSIWSPRGGFKTNSSELGEQESPNNLYFTPLAWEHFWAWMRLFNGALSLPVRQGKLFPESQAPSPKLGRYLATLKYRFEVAPLFVSHVYPQTIRSDWAKGRTTLVGIKARLGTFHLDMHQRLQEMLKERPELGETQKVFHKPFYLAEVDLHEIDLRTLCGQFTEPEKRLVRRGEGSDSGGHGDYEEEENVDDEDGMFSGDCTLPDRDLDWWDVRDFVEVGWTPPEDGTKPKIKLTQVLASPHFNYYRRIESKRERSYRTETQTGSQTADGAKAEEAEMSRLEFTKFGREKTHKCLAGGGPDPLELQMEISHKRLGELREELESLATCEASDSEEAAADLRRKITNVDEYLKQLESLRSEDPHIFRDKEALPPHMRADVSEGPTRSPAGRQVYEDWDTFDNRFIFHNPTIFFSNETRDALLKYYMSNRIRRGVVHHLTARAVRYIRGLSTHHLADESEDVDEEQPEEETRKHEAKHRRSRGRHSKKSQHKSGSSNDAADFLHGLLSDTAQHIISESPTEDRRDGTLFSSDDPDPDEGISDAFEVRRSNVMVLVKPQIVLRSQVNDQSSLIFTAVRMRLRNYAVIDPTSEEDSVNERALYRNFFTLDGLQAFHPSPKCDLRKFHQRHSGFVFVPLETLIDSKHESRDFDRVIPSTDASARYDKFNKLRLNDASRPVAADPDSTDPDVDHLIHHMDLVRVYCPRFAVLANSTHFAALYNVVTDLILYRDPIYQERAKRLETMMFSHDFSDTSGLAELVSQLQYRIRHGRELHSQYASHFEQLNEHGRLDFLMLKGEVQDMIEELNLIMDAIGTAEDTSAGQDKDKKSALRLEALAQNISWSMMGATEGELLAKLSVKAASFTWLNKADNSTVNTMIVEDLSAVSVQPDAVFTEIVAKYNKAMDHPMAQSGRFLDARWSVLPPVGGIPIMDEFEFNLHPLRVQLELKVGRQFMDYIFGSKRERERADKEKKAIERQTQDPEGVARKSRLARIKASLRPSHGPQEQGTTRRGSEVESSRASTRTVNSSASASRENVRRPNTPSSKSLGDSDDEAEETSHHAVANRDAVEMRNRASAAVTFVFAKVPETVFNLSFKGAKEKSITDLYDVVFRTPNIEYRNRTWGFLELANHFKRDVIRAAWGQKTSLLKGIFNARPRQRSIRAHLPSRITSNPLRFSVEPPTPQMSSERESLEDSQHSPRSSGSTHNRSAEMQEDSEDDDDETREGARDSMDSDTHPFDENEDDEEQGQVIELPAQNFQASGLTTSSSASPGRFSRFISKRLRKSSTAAEGEEHADSHPSPERSATVRRPPVSGRSQPDLHWPSSAPAGYLHVDGRPATPPSRQQTALPPPLHIDTSVAHQSARRSVDTTVSSTRSVGAVSMSTSSSMPGLTGRPGKPRARTTTIQSQSSVTSAKSSGAASSTGSAGSAAPWKSSRQHWRKRSEDLPILERGMTEAEKARALFGHTRGE